jgi:hypothetical protein
VQVIDPALERDRELDDVGLALPAEQHLLGAQDLRELPVREKRNHDRRHRDDHRADRDVDRHRK